MGMFDDVICDMPLPGEPKPKRNSFQTKDFSCSFDSFRIKEDGTLWVIECHEEDTRQLMFHGYLNFYTLEQEKPGSEGDAIWFEYRAKFTDGKLQGIEPVRISISHFGRDDTLLWPPPTIVSEQS